MRSLLSALIASAALSGAAAAQSGPDSDGFYTTGFHRIAALEQAGRGWMFIYVPTASISCGPNTGPSNFVALSADLPGFSAPAYYDTLNTTLLAAMAAGAEVQFRVKEATEGAGYCHVERFAVRPATGSGDRPSVAAARQQRAFPETGRAAALPYLPQENYGWGPE